ncbi:MAG: helix-turn-helix domain-containing GNAT family N-acetyltransferase [Devosia sp.]
MNRFYTSQIGLLNEHVARGRFSLAEGRVLYEIGKHPRITARVLARSLSIDPAYLSRILQKLLGLDLLRVDPSQSDRRSNTLALTSAGDAAVAELETLNDKAIEQVIEKVTPPDRDRLLAAMATVRALLGERSQIGPLILRPRRLGELGWLIHRQGLIYNRQFGWNGQFEALIAGIYSEYERAPSSPPKDLWVAEQAGGIVGSIFVMPSEGISDSAQLRMLYVEPSARGQGIGATLVAQAVGFARDNGYGRMRLWTHTIQESARRLYAAAGFAIVETMEEDNFGRTMTGEIWETVF